jgi:serine protease AprX
VINLSLGRPVFESFLEDPLDQAVERAYRAGLVVVASAGNYGRTQDGAAVIGGITSPGNSPYALTVGSLDSQGTVNRSDDVVSDYSSRGPTLFDRLVKPDIAAPGRKIVSLYVPGSTFAQKYPDHLVDGNGNKGLFYLSGTSMATGVVTGRGGAGARGQPAAEPAAGADCAADVVDVPAGRRADWRGRGRGERGRGGAARERTAQALAASRRRSPASRFKASGVVSGSSLVWGNSLGLGQQSGVGQRAGVGQQLGLG